MKDLITDSFYILSIPQYGHTTSRPSKCQEMKGKIHIGITPLLNAEEGAKPAFT